MCLFLWQCSPMKYIEVPSWQFSVPIASWALPHLQWEYLQIHLWQAEANRDIWIHSVDGSVLRLIDWILAWWMSLEPHWWFIFICSFSQQYMKTNKRVNEKTPFSMGDSWSNWFVFSLIVKLVFSGCISLKKQVASPLFGKNCWWKKSINPAPTGMYKTL